MIESYLTLNMKPLARFEEIAQRLVEGSLGRLFGGRLDPLEISAELAQSIEANQQQGFAPNEYIVQLNPTDYADLRDRWPDVAAILIQYILQIAEQLQLEIVGEPTVDVVATPTINRHYAQILASHQTPLDEATKLYLPAQQYDPLAALHLLDAFLILNGKQHLTLDRPNVTLGRRSDCDIVLDDRTISRRHAQIRWRFGRFVLYDLGSRGGTFVNGQRIEEFVLRPGDVFQLADNTHIIYGEGFTQPHSPKIRREGEQTTQMYRRATGGE